MTFGPEGMTGHPDHQAVSAWVEAAWRSLRPRRRPRLLRATTTDRWADRFADIHSSWASSAPGCP